MGRQQDREAALAGPCPYCGTTRADHDLNTLMPHALMSIGATAEEARGVWGRVLKRISA